MTIAMVVCAWCQKIIEDFHIPGEVSHGICAACERAWVQPLNKVVECR